MLRLMWFVNVPLARVMLHWGKGVTGSGFWMHELVKPLISSGHIARLVIVWAGVSPLGMDEMIEDGNVSYYVIHQPRIPTVLGIGSRRYEDRSLKKMLAIIERESPDILHFHGTEKFYGELKARRLTDIPGIVSIQGIINAIVPYTYGDMSRRTLIKWQRFGDIIRGCPGLRMKGRYTRQAVRERTYICSMQAVIGRTEWDRAYIWAYNSGVSYFHVDEILRPSFYGKQWEVGKHKRFVVFTTSGLTCAKGLHVLVEAIGWLRNEFPDVRLRVAATMTSSPESRFLQSKIKEEGLSDCIEWLGWLNQEQIVDELLHAGVFAYPSFIENSSNAVCEAQAIGIPVVCADAGGARTLIEHDQTGVLVRSGDAIEMAWAIRRIFNDEALAQAIGRRAAIVARIRHDPKAICGALLSSYFSVTGR